MAVISTSWHWVGFFTTSHQLTSGRQNFYSLTPGNFSIGVATGGGLMGHSALPPNLRSGPSKIDAKRRRFSGPKMGAGWPLYNRYLKFKFRAFSLLQRTFYIIVWTHYKGQWTILVCNQSCVQIRCVSVHTQVYQHAYDWDQLDIRRLNCLSNDTHKRILILIYGTENWIDKCL